MNHGYWLQVAWRSYSPHEKPAGATLLNQVESIGPPPRYSIFAALMRSVDSVVCAARADRTTHYHTSLCLQQQQQQQTASD